MLPSMDRKVRMEAFGKNLRFDYTTSYARKILVDLILADHTYARPSSLDPEFNRTHSTSLLFTKKGQEPPDVDDEDKEIDIEKAEDSRGIIVKYDTKGGKRQMSEVEECFRSITADENWQEDDQFSRSGWTRDQNRLFDQVYKVLSTYRMARCCYEGSPNEQIMRSLALEKTAKRFRNLAGAAAWDSKLMPWLHTTLVDGMNSYLFICYLELLQTLKAKIPTLVTKMIQYSTPSEDRSIYLNSPNISSCLNKAWDPTPNMQSIRTKESSNTTGPQESKLENKPLLMMLPRGPSVSLSHPKRSKFWQNQLSNSGRVLQMNFYDVEKPDDFAASAFLENVIGGTRSKISLFKSQFPGRSVVLLGWSVGALLACQVATLEQVAGVVCLGYPSNGLDGVREVEPCNIMEIKCPVMFVIGTHSSTCSADFIEGLREKLRVDTKMLLVEGGDEVLKLTSSQKKRMQITQNMVDRLIMDEIEAFIAEVLAKNDKNKDTTRPDTPSSSMQSLKSGEKKRKLKTPEIDKAVVEKKKTKISPSQQQRSQPSGKSSIQQEGSGSTKKRSKGCSSDNMMTPNELTMAATKDLASNASPLGKSELNFALSSGASDRSMGTSGERNQASKLVVKNHGKYGEKLTKKAKITKKPFPIPRPLSAPTNKGISQGDYVALQRFPTTSSILLSSSGAHLRLQDGRILRVSNADIQKAQPGTVISTGTALRNITSVNNQTQHTSTISVLGTSASSMMNTRVSSGSAIRGTVSTGLPLVTGTAQPKVVAGTPKTVIADQKASASSHNALKIVSGTTQVTSATDLTFASSSMLQKNLLSRSLSSPVSSVSTQLSPSDLKYLSQLFAKSQGDSLTVTSSDVITSTGDDASRPMPDSPISAKIGIGTLTNLPNADGSPPGSGTRHSPGSGLKRSAVSEAATTKEAQVPIFSSQSQVSKASQSNTTSIKNVNTSVSIANCSVTPGSSKAAHVTVSITSNTKAVVSNTATHQAKILQNKVSGSTSGHASSVSANSFATSNKISQSGPKLTQTRSAIDLSHLVKKAAFSVSSSAPNFASARQAFSLPTSSSGPAKLTVTSRQLYGTTSAKNPQTITLHIPNSAMLKDNTTVKTSTSEIKLIGLLNQTGRSPMSSPIHFAVKSSSAPGSPQSHSPTIFLTPKMEATSAGQVKAINLEKTKDGIVKAADDSATERKPVTTYQATVAVSAAKKTANVAVAKNGNPVKVSKPGSIQTALIKSLTAASFSLKQKESIANLLKRPTIIQQNDLKSQSDLKLKDDAVAQGTKASVAKGNNGTKTRPAKDGASDSISFVSDQSVPEVVTIGDDTKVKSSNELNGHSGGQVKDSDKELGKDGSVSKDSLPSNDDHRKSSQKAENDCIISDSPNAEHGKREANSKTKHFKEDARSLCKANSLDDVEIIEANHNTQGRKRIREINSPDISNDDCGPSVSKRLTRRGSTSKNGKAKLHNVQNTEE